MYVEFFVVVLTCQDGNERCDLGKFKQDLVVDVEGSLFLDLCRIYAWEESS